MREALSRWRSTAAESDEPASETVRAKLAIYWIWLAAALVLHLPVDLLTTLVAKSTVGIEYEANPLMRWLLGQPLAVVLAVHLAVGMLVLLFFARYTLLLYRAPARKQRNLAILAEVWLTLLFVSGLAVVTLNLTAFL